MTATNGEHRHLELCIGGATTAFEGFCADQSAIAATALDGSARLRLWHRAHPAVALGRFHRRARSIDGDISASGGDSPLERRLSGGRAVLLGPGVLGATLVTPSTEWLDDSDRGLRPDQVMNRALRPILAVLRGLGADLLYPGRDLITFKGQPVAHVSFTVLADGVTVVEMHVDLSGVMTGFADLLAKLDPDGVAGIDPGCWQNGLGLGDALGAGATVPPRLDGAGDSSRTTDSVYAQWAASFETACRAEFKVEVEQVEAWPSLAVAASAEAFADFLNERTAIVDAEGSTSAVTFAMLGVVEATATIRSGRFYDVVVSGDLLAPFHTLDDLSSGLEGKPALGPEVRRALVKVMSRPRNFLLGITDLDELILRLA
jgi:hypothetical protein